MNSSDSDIMYLINDCLEKDFENVAENVAENVDNILEVDEDNQKSDRISETITDSNDEGLSDDTNDNIEEMLQELESDNLDCSDIKTIIQDNFEKSEKIDKKAQLRETTSGFIKLLIEKFPLNNNINTLRSGFKDDKDKISTILTELGYEESGVFGKNYSNKRIEKRNKSWNIKIK